MFGVVLWAPESSKMLRQADFSPPRQQQAVPTDDETHDETAVPRRLIVLHVLLDISANRASYSACQLFRLFPEERFARRMFRVFGLHVLS